MTTKPSLGTSLAEALRETLRMIRDPGLFFWSLYLFTFPIYIFASGLPQPGDWLILLLAPVAFSQWNGRLPGKTASTMRMLVGFTAYVIVVNLTWSVLLGAWTLGPKTGFGLTPVFYIYNALVFMLVLVLHRRHGPKMLYLTAKILLGTLLVQAAIGLLQFGAGRATVLFNNPNQLGYYALLSASLLIILQRRGHATSLEVTVGMLAAIYLSLLSASKAALISILLLAIAGMVARLRTMLLIAAAFGVLLVVADPMFDALAGALNRIDSDSSYGFAEERGYDRILEHPEYWVVGSGEGAYNRFKETTAIGAHEIHSSIGTLFFSYGGVGTLLFGVFVWMTLRGTGLRTWLLVMPSLAYGMTHQGLRFTLFWVLLAIVVALREVPATVAPRVRPG